MIFEFSNCAFIFQKREMLFLNSRARDTLSKAAMSNPFATCLYLQTYQNLDVLRKKNAKFKIFLCNLHFQHVKMV